MIEKTTILKHMYIMPQSQSLATFIHGGGGVECGPGNLDGLDADSAKLTRDNLNIEITLNKLYFLKISHSFYPGDGTVPALSSTASRGHKGIKALFAHGQNGGNLTNTTNQASIATHQVMNTKMHTPTFIMLGKQKN
ncbi:hypothetical protein ACIPZC_25790 [Pseudomonas sp. NPDC089743]|uniref:hypothetical protein n=1 Tax=Pseudomonas sp. NPDC089743 TaxID=3364471 RepID=UPI003821F0D2